MSRSDTINEAPTDSLRKIDRWIDAMLRELRKRGGIFVPSVVDLADC